MAYREGGGSIVMMDPAPQLGCECVIMKPPK